MVLPTAYETPANFSDSRESFGAGTQAIGGNALVMASHNAFHMRRLLGENMRIEARSFLNCLFAAPAPVEHVDPEPRKPIFVWDSQIHLQAVRIRHNVLPARRR